MFIIFSLVLSFIDRRYFCYHEIRSVCAEGASDKCRHLKPTGTKKSGKATGAREENDISDG